MSWNVSFRFKSEILEDLFLEQKHKRKVEKDNTVRNVYFVKVYFSAQPNKLRPILKFKKYYPIEHIFVPAYSSALF